jgi:hypothetical protein
MLPPITTIATSVTPVGTAQLLLFSFLVVVAFAVAFAFLVLWLLLASFVSSEGCSSCETSSLFCVADAVAYLLAACSGFVATT